MKLHSTSLCGMICGLLLSPGWCPSAPAASIANRLAYLDEADPFYVHAGFPRLTTPQWIGEGGVDAVVTLAIDDLRETARYEAFLRPILERLKRINGHAPLSIFCNALNPEDPLFQTWLKEGISLEVHTLSHPCPILAKGDFQSAENTFHGGVDLLNHVPGNVPVAFRTPCCDSINSPSPRLYAELFNATNHAGQFLRMDSSVMMLFTTNDARLSREGIVDADGRGTFTKYVPFPSFMTTVENYPYPWVIGRLCWEFACMAPSDWEAHNLLGDVSPTLLKDWQSALDLVVRKQGTFNFVFHPHGWSSSGQFVAFIDHAVETYGPRVKFLNYQEAHERLVQHLTAGQPLRAPDGGDNGVRLVDLNNDGFLDVLIGNPALQRTRLWDPGANTWRDSNLPVRFVDQTAGGPRHDTGVRFGVVHADGRVTMWVRNERMSGAWSFDGKGWVEEPALLRGLDVQGEPVQSSRSGRDRGVRFRDVDGDGVCEFLVANESQNAAFHWNNQRAAWEPSDLTLPMKASLVTAQGEDNGVRFVDLNNDGHDDVVFSNEQQFGLWLYQAQADLGWTKGWTRKVMAGTRARVVGSNPPVVPAPPEEIPAFVRAGAHRNNGAWFRSRHLWVQNEDTASLTNLVDRRSFDDLVRGVLPGPKSPAEALRSFQLRAGFRIEAVAAEPLVQDPVAFDWSADGRLWVVEMRDYPLGIDGRGGPGGVVKCLEDTKGNGTYDRATEFLTGLNFPNGILAWRKGVIISAAPDILYAEDTDGDGRADVRRTLFTGFREGNQQHRVNGFVLGLDGWVYGANGDSGGTVRNAMTDARVELRGADLRFRPDTGEFEAIDGPTQFGRNRDDWGHWFGNANYTWLWHYPWPSRYLARNPHLTVPETRQMLTESPDQSRVFPISHALPRPNSVGEENTVTSACSAMPYRDDLFGPEFATSVFIAEPSENVIHREVLKPAGSGFSSARAGGEETSEFLASSDVWFRPVFLRTGPDGALYVADMYRLIIEHPEWIPADLQQRLDLRAGSDRGRIYRIIPQAANLRPRPRLDRLDTAGLVAALDHPNGWQRDTAMRLLTERRDPGAVALLKQLLAGAVNPKTRLQALATLDLIGGLDREALLGGLYDRHRAVRAAALSRCEPLLRAGDTNGAIVQAAVLRYVPSSPEDTLQWAFTLGECRDPDTGTVLVRLIQANPADDILLTAVLSSALPHLVPMLKAVGAINRPPAGLLERLLGLAAAAADPVAIETGVTDLLRLDPSRDAMVQFTALAALLEAQERRGAGTGVAFKDIEPVFERASDVAFNEHAQEGLRLSALRLLAPALARTALPAQRMTRLLEASQSPAIQEAALKALRRRDEPEVADELVRTWETLTPALKSGAIDLLLTRPVWIDRLLQGVEAHRLASQDLGISARQRLLTHDTPAIRERAVRLLAPIPSDRQAVVDRLVRTMPRPGERAHGEALFHANCTACHRLHGEGFEVGPDLGAVIDKSPETLLIAIVDPNRAIEERYLAYTARTRTGREFAGIIVSESPNSLTLRNASGAEEVFLRSELDSVKSTGRSLMPEGFELNLEPVDFADLIAYVASSGARPKEFPGNQPAMVSTDEKGVIRLMAGSAEIYGDTLVFEPKYQNLGYWRSANDAAVWTVQVPRDAQFEVWLDGALEGTANPGRVRIQTGAMALEASVSNTGSWDHYRQARLGSLKLEAGRHRVVVRGTPPLDGAIVDLRELRFVPAGDPPPPDFHDLVKSSVP